MKYRLLKRAAALALTICLLAPGVSAAQQERPQTLTCIVADGQYVNVRNRASSSAATWGILHTGDTIEALPQEITDGFFRTEYDGRVAYVSVRYFEIPVNAPYVVRANGRVRVRETPAGTAAGFVQPGDRVYVSAWRYAADGSRWARCTGGQFISADFLEPEA